MSLVKEKDLPGFENLAGLYDWKQADYFSMLLIFSKNKRST